MNVTTDHTQVDQPPGKFRVFADAEQLAIGFANDLRRWIADRPKALFLALSGGSTPQRLFQYLNSPFGRDIDWSGIHFFWGDERCVPAESQDSNYGTANRLFLRNLSIPCDQIHPIDGDAEPHTEAERYAMLLAAQVPRSNRLPCFDLMILGMGNDGHTASIFPDQMNLMECEPSCAVARHPDNGQLRVTLTGNVLANARRIVFLITGSDKAEKVTSIVNRLPESNRWPATRLFHLPSTTLYLDRSAASMLPGI